MPYNIYLDSPQLAYQANQRKQYLRIIRRNNFLQNNLPKRYNFQYYQTAYNRFIQSNSSFTPGY